MVRPIRHPPRRVPPRAADQRSPAYPTLLRVLRCDRYGHRGGAKPLRLGPSPASPVRPFSPAPSLAVLVTAVGFLPLLPGVRWWWWGGGSSPPLAELLVCVYPPLLAGARDRWWRVVPHHSWLRVLGVAPRHSLLGSAGGAGGVGLCHSLLRSAGLWGVVVAGDPSLLAEGPGRAFPRHSWLRAPGAVRSRWCWWWMSKLFPLRKLSGAWPEGSGPA